MSMTFSGYINRLCSGYWSRKFYSKDSMGSSKFEGKPCSKGHTLRYSSTGKCVQCKIDWDRKSKVK